jgi:hypothetical protein
MLQLRVHEIKSHAQRNENDSDDEMDRVSLLSEPDQSAGRAKAVAQV